MTNTDTITPADWADAARSGFTLSFRRYQGSRSVVVELSARFTPGDRAAYMVCEQRSLELLAYAPATQPGTTWGSDSGSVGGHAALMSGDFHMCKSGVSVRWATAAAKAAGKEVVVR